MSVTNHKLALSGVEGLRVTPARGGGIHRISSRYMLRVEVVETKEMTPSTRYSNPCSRNAKSEPKAKPLEGREAPALEPAFQGH